MWLLYRNNNGKEIYYQLYTLHTHIIICIVKHRLFSKLNSMVNILKGRYYTYIQADLAEPIAEIPEFVVAANIAHRYIVKHPK